MGEAALLAVVVRPVSDYPDSIRANRTQVVTERRRPDQRLEPIMLFPGRFVGIVISDHIFEIVM